jgi:hypothetical protein
MEAESLEKALQEKLAEFWAKPRNPNDWTILSEMTNGAVKATIAHNGKTVATAHVAVNSAAKALENAERIAIITAIGRLP